LSIDENASRSAEYSEAYLADYGFESVMVRMRQDNVLSLLPEQCRSVVEIGCGVDLLVERLPEQRDIAHWIIVEPSDAFADAVRDRVSPVPFVTFIHARIQDAVSAILEVCPTGADLVICSSLLHEVDEPQTILSAASAVMNEHGHLLVNVPNAGSLHRRLAVAMGLMSDLHEKSERNRVLQQTSVFDRDSLRALLVGAGYDIVSDGGYFLKPFTHAQMDTLSFLDPPLLRALQVVGTEFPDFASEIYALASRRAIDG
jgi:SAM-dependent methyltransferase